MGNKPNWVEIEKCQMWRILGVIGCDDCNDLIKCWGTNSQLPELTSAQREQWENHLKQLFRIKQ